MNKKLMITVGVLFALFAATVSWADYYGALWGIDDYLTFACATHNPETGASYDADAVPDYNVYEDVTGTAILSGVLAKLDDAGTTGFYTQRIQLTAANGFELGKCYHIVIEATVDSNEATTVHNFKLTDIADATDVQTAAAAALTAYDPPTHTEVDANFTPITADTNELQTDWANGGRLDALIDLILADSNELQTDWADGGRLDLILDSASASATAIETGTVTTGTTISKTSFTLSSGFPATLDAYPPGTIIGITDAGDSNVYLGTIKSYSAARKVELFTPLAILPANADVAAVYPAVFKVKFGRN